MLALSVAQAFADTTITAGSTVQVGVPTAFPSGFIIFTGDGTLSFTSSGVLANDITFDAGVNGTISNGAGVAPNVTLTLSGKLSGDGALVKAGSNRLILTGDNTFSGGTTISAGTLQIGIGSTTGSIVGNVANSAVLSFNRSNDSTFSGVISGTGTLTKLGAGVLTLTGTNTYTGITTISSGTLQVGDGGTTGSIAGSVILSNSSVVTALRFNRSDDVTFAGQVSGSNNAELIQQGGGVLTLTGDIGVRARINSGTLQVGDGGTAGSISGNVINNANLTFNRSDNLTYSSSISGTGAVTKLGAGVLTLTGNHTYTGGTTISDGILQIGNGGGSGRIRGDVLNNAVLAFNVRPFGGGETYSDVISGEGALTKLGPGVLTFTEANAYTGGTTIDGGTLNLAVVNALAATGAVTVNAGTLDLSSFNQSVGNVTLAGGSINGTSGILEGWLYEVYAGSVSAVLGGGAYLAKSTTGTVILTGSNTYTGGTYISEGTLQLGDGGTTGSIVGYAQIDGGTLAFNRSDDVSFAGAIVGAGTLRKQGVGTLTLGPATTALGNVDVLMGTLSLPTGLVVTGAVTNQGGIATSGTLTVDGSLANNGSLTLNGATLNGAGALANYNLLTGSGSIAGSGGFSNYGQVMPSGGPLVLANTGSNVNYGNWDVPAGLPLALNGASLTNAGVVNLAGGLISGSGTLVNGPDGTVTGRGTITAALSNQGVLALGGGTLAVIGGFASSGQIQLSSSSAVLSGGLVTNSGRIEGFGKVNNAVDNSGMVEAIGGTLTLAGSLTNASGGIIAAGSGAKVLVNAGLASNAGQIQLAGGTFDNNGAALTNATSGVITGFGTLRSGAVANDGRVLLAGGNSAAHANLVSNGGSQVVLSGNSNTTFHGTVEIKDGAELRVSQGSVATFFAQVNQRNGALFTGTGAKHYEGGFAVGNSPGLGTDPGNVSFGAGNVYEAEIGGTNPGDAFGAGIQFDRYVVGGMLTFGGTLKVVQFGGYVPQAGNSFDLFDWGTRAGQFAALDFSAAPLAGGLAWDTSNLYVDGTLSVAAVPEPGSYAMMLAGLGLIGFTAFRRRAAKAA